MGISQEQPIDTFFIPFGTTARDMEGYAKAIGGELQYRNEQLYLRTRNGGNISIIMDCSRPRLH